MRYFLFLALIGGHCVAQVPTYNKYHHGLPDERVEAPAPPPPIQLIPASVPRTISAQETPLSLIVEDPPLSVPQQYGFVGFGHYSQFSQQSLDAMFRKHGGWLYTLDSKSGCLPGMEFTIDLRAKDEAYRIHMMCREDRTFAFPTATKVDPSEIHLDHAQKSGSTR